jgi:uncharacterized protein Yka (UPF0111/DUF47 family)
MDKNSSQQVANVLADAATTLRSQQETIHELQSKLASRSMRDRVEKLASAMHNKGIELDSSVEVLADRLEKMAEATPGKLDAIEHGVDMVGPDMGMKVAQLTSDGAPEAGAISDLERYIIGHAG